MKAISVNIFKSRGGDCSNGGISSKFNEVLIACDEGWIDIDENNPPENLCKVVQRELWGERHWYVEPCADKPRGSVGYMYGGCIIDSSDARWDRMSGGIPLHLHDRCESQELYDALSR